jgi:hypothetical protein
MNIYDLIIASPFITIAYGIWQHNNVSILAKQTARKHCQQVGVQLLDQNILLKRIRIARSPHSLFALKRIYGFEFSSIGDFRYQGSIVLLGKRTQSIELEPFKMHSESHL